MKLVRQGVEMRAEEEKYGVDILKARKKSSCHGQLRYSYFWSKGWVGLSLEGSARSKFL